MVLMCVNALGLAVSAGVLLGIAIRTGSPLSLNLAEPVWKQLAGMNLTIADLSEVRTPPRCSLHTDDDDENLTVQTTGLMLEPLVHTELYVL